jgi:hypothetical protein
MLLTCFVNWTAAFRIAHSRTSISATFNKIRSFGKRWYRCVEIKQSTKRLWQTTENSYKIIGFQSSQSMSNPRARNQTNRNLEEVTLQVIKKPMHFTNMVDVLEYTATLLCERYGLEREAHDLSIIRLIFPYGIAQKLLLKARREDP